MKTLKSFIKATNINATLVRAVVRQAGGWETFKETAIDVANHGANHGVSGFIYYNDTVAFTKRQKANIMELAKEQANDFGSDSVYSMIASFNCLNDVEEYEVAQAIHTGKGEMATQIYNALAWYALEEVSRAYSYATEE